MLLHCDQPDLLLAYLAGSAGRMLIHTTMLSPEVHTWDQSLEQILEQTPTVDHATLKLEYIKQSVFPDYLVNSLSKWKQHEPVPWGATIEQTRKTIRHCWMYETYQELQRFNCSKLAYVDFSKSLPFMIRACVEKKIVKIIDQPPSSQQVIVDQLYKTEQCLNRWNEYSQDNKLHKIDLHNFLFSDTDRFKQEYYDLCNYYEITPMLQEAMQLKQHWLSIQWKRRSKFC